MIELACFVSLSFAGLVVLARSLNPIPFRTRPLNSSAPMVLWLKPWESRSLPGLPRIEASSSNDVIQTTPLPFREAAFFVLDIAPGADGSWVQCRRACEHGSRGGAKREA